VTRASGADGASGGEKARCVGIRTARHLLRARQIVSIYSRKRSPLRVPEMPSCPRMC
jgi:hypothetical protein